MISESLDKNYYWQICSYNELSIYNSFVNSTYNLRYYNTVFCEVSRSVVLILVWQIIKKNIMVFLSKSAYVYRLSLITHSYKKTCDF